MDIQLILEIITLSGAVAVGTAHFLGKRLIEHRLSKDLKQIELGVEKSVAEHKATLDAVLSASKATHEAALRRDLELFLGDRSAERVYAQEARRRLYLAVGPLRFQLLQSCVEFSNRVEGIVRGNSYGFSMETYFGRSTAYRILRMLGICELIDRQVAFADFSVDPDIRHLLAYKRQMQACLSSGKITLGHPTENWEAQHEHLFRDTVSSLGSMMIVTEGDSLSRVKRYEEFVADQGTAMTALRYQPLSRLLVDFTPDSKPLLWLRLLALAASSANLVKRQGAALELETEPIDLEIALDRINDPTIRSRRTEYRKMLQDQSQL